MRTVGKPSDPQPREAVTTQPEGTARPQVTSRVRLMGMALDPLAEEQVVARVLDDLTLGRGGAILTPNLDILRQYRRSAALRDAFAPTELVLADGMPLVWACRLQATPLPRRVAGSELIWSLTAGAAAQGASVFLAGGDEGVAERAAERLCAEYPSLRVAGTTCPWIAPGTPEDETGAAACAIVAARPDIVFLGLPLAKQVHMMTVLRPLLPASWLAGVGVSFSFVSGDLARAPVRIRHAGFEWAHRLVHEPRLWRRYLVQGLPFAGHLAVHALGARHRRRAESTAD
jgi:N-acetylglucosaminyldiphosphoundecaprenol N-acetyl-beta-D-mannosaminyltransferase